MCSAARHKCQVELSNTDEPLVYKSLYLDTLSGRAKRTANGAELEAYLHGTLTTKGIERAQPTQFHKHVRTSQVTLAKVFVEDAGMRPKVLHPDLHKPDAPTLSTADIDGAQPHCKTVITNARDTNPLEPCYQLATCSQAQPPEPAPFIRSTLDVSDIAQRSRPCSAPHARRSSGLDVSDIEGSSPGWRRSHSRQQQARDHTLNVRDITCDGPRFKVLCKGSSRENSYKGDPAGPKLVTHVHARHAVAQCDNSLRTLDIEGVGLVRMWDSDYICKLSRRHAKTHNNSTRDIEGAQPADRDKTRLFHRKQAALRSKEATQDAAQAVLSTISVDQSTVKGLWEHCRSLDRDSSGFLTASEFTGALKACHVELGSAQEQQLASGLQDNVGLINYRSMSKALLQKAQGQEVLLPSRPGSASATPVWRDVSSTAAASSAPAAAAAAAAGGRGGGVDASAGPSGRLQSAAAGQREDYSGISAGDGVLSTSRPSTAMSRLASCSNLGTQQQQLQQQQQQQPQQQVAQQQAHKQQQGLPCRPGSAPPAYLVRQAAEAAAAAAASSDAVAVASSSATLCESESHDLTSSRPSSQADAQCPASTSRPTSSKPDWLGGSVEDTTAWRPGTDSTAHRNGRKPFLGDGKATAALDASTASASAPYLDAAWQSAAQPHASRPGTPTLGSSSRAVDAVHRPRPGSAMARLGAGARGSGASDAAWSRCVAAHGLGFGDTRRAREAAREDVAAVRCLM